MGQSISIYFRPTETLIKETQYDSTGVYYTITTKVNFYTDEAMTKLAYDKEFTFAQVPYTKDWDGILSSVYTLINNNI